VAAARPQQPEWERLYLRGEQIVFIKGYEGEWYWHMSCASRMADQSDTFPTEDECRADAFKEYPNAIECKEQ
jgi:hypothetical protein